MVEKKTWIEKTQADYEAESPSFAGLQQKDKNAIMYSDFAFAQMKDAKKVDVGEVHPKWIERRKRDTKQGKKGSLKIYTFSRYGRGSGVNLYCLIAGNPWNYQFLVEYTPLGWFFGFDNYDEAYGFAKIQAERFNSLDRMLR